MWWRSAKRCQVERIQKGCWNSGQLGFKSFGVLFHFYTYLVLQKTSCVKVGSDVKMAGGVMWCWSLLRFSPHISWLTDVGCVQLSTSLSLTLGAFTDYRVIDESQINYVMWIEFSRDFLHRNCGQENLTSFPRDQIWGCTFPRRSPLITLVCHTLHFIRLLRALP